MCGSVEIRYTKKNGSCEGKSAVEESERSERGRKRRDGLDAVMFPQISESCKRVIKICHIW